MFAPIDAGSHLLAHTGLSVLGAPYHRNVAGNLAVLDGFARPPDDARSAVVTRGVRYVALCPGSAQISAMARAAPDGLAAALVAGRVPGWLRPVRLDGPTPYRVYTAE